MNQFRKILIQGKRSIKEIRRNVHRKFQLNESYLKNAGGVRILVYHGICLNDPYKFNTLFLTMKKFERHLQLYKKYFDVVSLNNVFEKRLNPERFSVCLTFDDGFANNYKNVLPLLEKYEVPATFFITSITESGYNFLWNDALSIAGKIGPAELIFKKEMFRKTSNGQYLSILNNQSINHLLRNVRFECKAELT